MKSLIHTLIVVFCSAVSTWAQRGNNFIDIQHYIFEIEVNDTTDVIDGTATIRFVTQRHANHITLELVSKKTDGKGMGIISVTENGKPLQYIHSNDSIQIHLSEAAGVGTKTTIQIKYKGVPADGLIIDQNKYGNRTFFSDHWPNRARNWLPCVDHPSDKASVEFKITAPLHYQVISNGVMVEKTNLDDKRRFTHYREENAIPMKVAAVGIADFAMRVEGEVDHTPVESWVYPEEREKGFYDYSQAVEMFPFFIKNIGPYPFKKLANIQSKTVFGGMENAGAIFYYENSVTGNRTAERLIAHEIAHQWFGNTATEADWSHVWLSEGFATYLAILYMEQAHGTDTAADMRIIDRMKAIAFAKQKNTPIIDTTVTDYLDLLNANSYQKAGWVLHMLRKQLGDSTFWKCIRTYYNTYKGRNAITDDFRKIVEEISGKDYKDFFQQWMYTAGHPKLQIDWRYQPKEKQVVVFIEQMQQKIFDFPIELKIVGSKPHEEVVSRININEKKIQLNIPVNFKPKELLVDPSVDLFFEGSVKQLR